MREGSSKLIDSRDGALLLNVERAGDGTWMPEYEYPDGVARKLRLD